MRRFIMLLLLASSVAVHATDTLRVGAQVLVKGDPAAHAIELLGAPVFRQPFANTEGVYTGELWQFKQDTGRIVTITIFYGRVANIQESPIY